MGEMTWLVLAVGFAVSGLAAVLVVAAWLFAVLAWPLWRDGRETGRWRRRGALWIAAALMASAVTFGPAPAPAQERTPPHPVIAEGPAALLASGLNSCALVRSIPGTLETWDGFAAMAEAGDVTIRGDVIRLSPMAALAFRAGVSDPRVMVPMSAIWTDCAVLRSERWTLAIRWEDSDGARLAESDETGAVTVWR